ncbi:unnamed protein product [Parascedosporium putredinis]|uniref:Orotate phosphoribosyltransferase n=1 Tax=Parascedosporium putredinis TaxID=1442378 RepID=A0A9P1GUG1_9PEZI|nr:unnamed protein product [Parascedosporium putredinis]CAI7987602.1 unnamed protein product [Parascedosporium putredinis]
MALPQYKADFLKAAIDGGVLKFGQFELKSKRISPYFFNAGSFYRSDLLQSIAHAFAKTIIEAVDTTGLEFDIVFGPAYKGIPLATLTTYCLGALEPRFASKCYSFDRKEAKDHGEGGNIVASFPDGDDTKPMPSAIGELRKEYGLPIFSILTLDDIIDGMKSFASETDIKNIEEYRAKYKASD